MLSSQKQKDKPCKYCGKSGHTSLMCHDKPRKPLKAKKAMHRFGKVTAKWFEVRGEWMHKNPPSQSGHWTCFYYAHDPLRCAELLTIDTLTVDHMLSRSRRPDLRYELDNLVACCAFHNDDKGSLSSDEYIAKLKNAIK